MEVRQDGRRPLSYWLVAQIGSTGSLLGFTLIVTMLAVCGFARLVP